MIVNIMQKNTIKYLFLFAVACAMLCLYFVFDINAYASSEKSTLTVYPEYDSRIPKCYDYGVTVCQGDRKEKLIVYNRNANGEQMSNRCFNPDFNRRFCEFAFTGEVRVDIEVYMDFKSYSILPSAKNYRNEYHDGVISVWLDKNDTNFMIRLDDDDSTILSVFADAPEEYKYDKNDSSVLYVDEKWYDPNGDELIYNVPSNIKTIYIKPGCVLYSRLLIKTSDVTVCGHGMLVDPYSDYYDTQSIGVDNYKMVIRVEGSNITIRDIKMIDSQNWNIYLYDGYYHDIIGVKMLTARITTDGIAVGSGNVNIENCFFYVSDNVFTYSGDKGYHHIKNCILGTTCAAFFMQYKSSYEIDFTDMYVFRANEGIVSNSYNSSQIQSDVKHVIFTNLDAVDIVHAPWIFKSFNMGDADKYFTFQNCNFANIRGDSNIEAWNETNGQSVIVINKTGYLHTSGYRLEFFDCTLDGKTITKTSDLNTKLTEGDEITFTIQNTNTNGLNRTTKYTVNNVYDKKVYIGNYLQPLKNHPETKNGVLYVPEREICKALGIKVNKETKGTVINSAKYITLETMKDYYTNAKYDETKKAVIIDVIANIKANLVKDFSFTSRWNPYAYPNVILGPYVDSNKEVVLRCDVNSNVNYPGMFTEITDDLKKNGAAIYILSFDAKSTDGASYDGQVWVSNIKYEGYKEIERKITHNYTIKGSWASYEIKLDLSNWNISDEALSFIRICSSNTPGYDVLFKNIKMVKEGAARDEDYIDDFSEDEIKEDGKEDSTGESGDFEQDKNNDTIDISKCTISFEKKNYYYTGKSQKPKLIIKYKDAVLVSNKDFTLSYGKNKKVGKGYVTVAGKGNYYGSVKCSFIIKPSRPTVKKLTPYKGQIKVKWSRKSKEGVRYKIQYSTSKNFKNKKTVVIKSTKKTSAIIKGLKSRKTYYVRVCAYKKVKGKTYRGRWSKVKKVNVK